MKEIKAVIRPNKLSSLRETLRAIPGFPGMTVSKVEGCSARSALHLAHQPKDDLADYVPKVRVEILAPDELAQEIVELIIKVGQTGQVGDGLVWMTEVAQATFLFKTTSLGAGRSEMLEKPKPQ
mgnify:CR=1 FL=1